MADTCHPDAYARAKADLAAEIEAARAEIAEGLARMQRRAQVLRELEERDPDAQIPQ